MHIHVKEVCKEHGHPMMQCRCMGPKKIKHVECSVYCPDFKKVDK